MLKRAKELANVREIKINADHGREIENLRTALTIV